MPKHTARLIVTLKCKRKCSGCCNNDIGKLYKPIGLERSHISWLRYPYEEVCITGGEPLLVMPIVKDAIGQLTDKGHPIPKIYLYSSIYDYDKLSSIMDKIDGLHYTLHYPLKEKDLSMLKDLQTLIFEHKLYAPKSYRLFIDNRITQTIPIKPNLWSRIEVKPWLNHCPLPENETLFILANINLF